MDLCHFSAGHAEDYFIDDAAGITLKTSQTATFTRWKEQHVGVEGARRRPGLALKSR